MRPDWAIYCTLGNFSKPVATINLPKSLTFLGSFCIGVKIYNFSSEIIFGATFIDIWRLFTGHTITRIRTYVPTYLDLDRMINAFCSFRLRPVKQLFSRRH